jgi:tetratricopeptide (TPR) repeat protein
MVLVFTGNANNSNEIKKEMALASQHNLAVIPVRVEDVVPNDAFAYEFATRQWIDTFGNWETAIERLSHQIAQVPGSGARETVPPPRVAPAKGSSHAGLLAVAAVVVVIAAAAGAYIAFKPSSPPSAPAPQATAPAETPASADQQPILNQANRALRSQNYAEAFRLYQQAADQGLPTGEYVLGNLYRQGLGTPHDYAKAMDWYRKSADQGFGSAFAGIGQLYHLGNGVPQDYAEARRWFQLAADKGAAFGFVGLGSLYLNGQGVPRDYDKALNYFREGADRGGPAAGYFIGLMYEHGQGVPVDLAVARGWMKKSAELGNPDAQTWLNQH